MKGINAIIIWSLRFVRKITRSDWLPNVQYVFRTDRLVLENFLAHLKQLNLIQVSFTKD